LDTPEGKATAACIDNLRRIDGARQQWALEFKKASTDTPTWDDIKPYLNRAEQSTNCPAGGTYSLNLLSAVPTCSVPGHALPQ
jgi:general secretion pathway protein G